MTHQLDIPANRVSQIIASKRSIMGDTALRFGPKILANLQSQFELDVENKDRVRDPPPNVEAKQVNVGSRLRFGITKPTDHPAWSTGIVLLQRCMLSIPKPIATR